MLDDNAPIVLVIEDEKLIVNFWASALRDVCRLYAADTTDSGRRLIEQYPDAAVIVLDGCLNAVKPNTHHLITLLHERNYQGIILAVSNDSDFQREQMELGCTFAVHKLAVPQFLTQQFLERRRA